MKVKTTLIIACICSIILSGCSNDDNGIETPKTLKDDIENQEFVKIIEDNISDIPKNVQIAIAVINNESTEYIGVYNNNGVLRRIDNADKVFEIASITKVFTGICLSKLVSTNNTILTETLQSQFAFPLLNGGDITLLQLANHTSGLPRLPTNIEEVVGFNTNDPYADYNINHLESYLQNHIALNSVNGTEYEYSNLGMGILGYILSKKADMSYEELLQSEIFEPLQMTNSTTLLANVDATKLVIGRDENDNTVPYWNYTDVSTAGASIKSSVIDLEKFVRKNFEDDLVYNLPQETTFEIAPAFSVGLGWHILEVDGFKVLYHDGGTGGFCSELKIDKNNKKAVIVLANVSGLTDTYSKKISELASSLLENISLQ